jgi:type I restriction enzyme R subunit
MAHPSPEDASANWAHLYEGLQASTLTFYAMVEGAVASRRIPEPQLDRLSNIVRSFNDQFGNIDWKDADKISKVIAEEIPGKVAADKAYQNAMKNSDKQNARIEHDRALQRVLIELLTDHTELFKQFQDNPSFKRWLGDTVFSATYTGAPAGKSEQPTP